MLRRLSIAGLALIMIALLYVGAIAQGRGPGNGMNRSQLNEARLVTLTGLIGEIQVAAGQGTPSLRLSLGEGKEVTVILGPYRSLVEKNLDIKAGSHVSIQAIQSSRFENTFAAVQIDNLDTRSTVTLRDPDGMPMWARGLHRGNGPVACGQCELDVAGKKTFVGTVSAVSMGIAQGFPNFTLATGDGNVTIVASPFRALLDAGYTVSVGQSLSVVAFPSSQHEGAYVAAELTDSKTGASLMLRDAQGVPVNAGTRRGAGSCVCPRNI
jgi:hypothetical protein